MFAPSKIRNIAIIAHIDHGKTTLLDAMLKQSNVFRTNEAIPERVMDSYDQERERGITIFAKHTGIRYGDYKVNIIDTPGHSDFSGEVERVLGMVNSVLLLVDAQEGPMPQTRFVLSKALKMGLKPIVVINKIDRPHADPHRVLNETFDLFAELGADDHQLDFRHCYASGLAGFSMQNLEDPRENMAPLFDLIVEAVPSPSGDVDDPFLMQVRTVTYNDYLGRQATGRVLQGSVKKGQQVVCANNEGKQEKFTITRVEGYEGLKKVEFEIGAAGDIISVSGIPEVMLGDSLCDPDHVTVLPAITLDEPSVSANFMINNSPFVGRDGKNVTYNKIKERLLKEKRSNISLHITEYPGEQEAITVSGRGELHLAVLIEAMRREGYELSVSKPQVIVKVIDGQRHEPIESVHVEVPEEFSGVVIEELARRRGEMLSLNTNEHGVTSLEYRMPTRGLMGYRNEFLTVTRGLGVITSIFDSFQPWRGEIPHRKKGVLISMCDGRVTDYALDGLQSRGVLFVKAGDQVYEGMVVGENSRDNDLSINVTRAKQLTNFRASGKDENVLLAPPRVFTLEQGIDYIEDDELVEVTPSNIRIRKTILKEQDRKRNRPKDD
ncbi:MAG: translational GTPase TypA [Nitrosomonas sp.]|nr:MAG: translational GTPase TypA [Nitrosomonas sp.]